MLKPLWVLLFLVCGAARADDGAIQILKQAGGVALMRHASAPGTGDPSGFRLEDCATQRNLSAAGRDQARRIGQMLKAQGVRAQVFSSQWCRARDTARLLDMGPVQPLPALNSLIDSTADRDGQTAAVRSFIAGWQGPPLILVTHQVNITALTGLFVADGEMIVLRPGVGSHAVAGRLSPPD
jgi:phosphohistidine phosphatase SixA